MVLMMETWLKDGVLLIRNCPSEQDFKYRSTFANQDFLSAISSSRFAKYSDWLRMAINLFRELPISALKKHLLPNDTL